MNVILSFDDGREDQYRIAYPILTHYGLRASFHITTGFVDGTYKTDDFGTNRKSVTINQIKTMHQNGMDISLHGDKHITDPLDYEESYCKMLKWIGKDKYGFSVPGSNYSANSLRSFLANCKNKPSYIRVGRNPACYSFFKKIMYVLYRITKAQPFFNSFNLPNIINKKDKYLIYSLVVKKYTKPSSIEKFLKKYNDQNSTIVLMFHSIVDETPNDVWEYKKQHFEQLCSFLKNNASLNIVTLEEFADSE